MYLTGCVCHKNLAWEINERWIFHSHHWPTYCVTRDSLYSFAKKKHQKGPMILVKYPIFLCVSQNMILTHLQGDVWITKRTEIGANKYWERKIKSLVQSTVFSEWTLGRKNNTCSEDSDTSSVLCISDNRGPIHLTPIVYRIH